MKIVLKKPIKKDSKEIKELNLDFDKISGHAIIAAEKSARVLGDQTPDISFSMTFATLLAAQAAEEKVNYDDLLGLNGSDFMGLTKQVSNFLFEWALPMPGTGK